MEEESVESLTKRFRDAIKGPPGAAVNAWLCTLPLRRSKMNLLHTISGWTLGSGGKHVTVRADISRRQFLKALDWKETSSNKLFQYLKELEAAGIIKPFQRGQGRARKTAYQLGIVEQVLSLPNIGPPFEPNNVPSFEKTMALRSKDNGPPLVPTLALPSRSPISLGGIPTLKEKNLSRNGIAIEETVSSTLSPADESKPVEEEVLRTQPRWYERSSWSRCLEGFKMTVEQIPPFLDDALLSAQQLANERGRPLELAQFDGFVLTEPGPDRICLLTYFYRRQKDAAHETSKRQERYEAKAFMQTLRERGIEPPIRKVPAPAHVKTLEEAHREQEEFLRWVKEQNDQAGMGGVEKNPQCSVG